MMEMTAGKLLLSAPPIQFASSIGIGIGQQQSASSPIATSSAAATTIAATSMSFSSLFNQNDENGVFKMESINSSPLSLSSASAFAIAPSEQEANGRALIKHESEEEMALMAPGPAAAMPSASPPSDPTQMPTMLIPSATEASTAGGQNIGLQSNSNNGNRPLAVLKPPGDEKEERPSLSYKDLIIEAIESCPERRLKLSEIYQVIKYLHPYYQRRADQWGWQNSIRHNLSLHDCFVKLPLKQTSANGVVGHFWTVIHRNPEDKPGPTRRRSRANILVGGGTVGSVSGKGRKANSTNGSAQRQIPIASRATSMANGGGKAAKGLKGRQSVSSDSGVMSDDGGMSQCQSGNISPSMAGGSASVPAILQIPSAGEPSKFQPLPSPLTLSNHQPLASLHLPLQQPQPSQSFHQTQPTTPLFHHQAAQNLLSPLELVMNGQHSSNSLIQSPHQPLTQQQFQFSPIPGKTAPAQSGQLLEQQLQQLLAMANFAQQQQPLAAQQQMTAEPVTPASAPPTLLHPLTPTSASLPTDAASAGGLSLLSHLASQALAAAAQHQPQPAQTQLPQPQLAIAAAAAAAELQRLQLLQLYAQQQQQQLQQQLALLEQTQQQQQQQQNHHQIRHHHFGGHSAPLSPVEEHQTHQQDQQSFLTQLLLARLLTSNSAEQAQQPQQQQQIPQLLHHHALAQKTSPPPPLSAPAGVINSQPPPQLDLHQAALLLEQYQQQQQRQQQQQQQQQQLLLLEQIQREQQQQLEAAVAAAIGAQIGNGTAAGNGTVGSAETAQQQIQTAIQAAVDATTTATAEAQQQQQQQQMLVEPELAVV